MLNIEWESNGVFYWGYYLDIIKENTKSVYAEGIYGDVYRVEKNSKKLYINGKYISIVSSCEIL